MPMVVCLVDRVMPRTVRMGHQRFRAKFDVYPVRDPEAVWTPVFETFDPWKASLCRRASELGKPVTVALRETAYGFEIVSVEMDEEQVAS